MHLDATRHDPTAQTLSAQQVVIATAGIRFFPVQGRYIWLAELD